MSDTAIPVIIPSILPEELLLPLARQITATAGCPHRIVLACSSASAAVNRNRGLDLAGPAEIVAMLDDDVEPMHEGWLRIMLEALARPEVLMVSAQLYRPAGGYNYMTGLDDWGGVGKPSGETLVPTKRLLTACCAFRPLGCRFDEEYVGSGFEDIAFCNELSAIRPDGVFLVCHDAHVIHRNEQREQRGENWARNKARYESKWGRVESRDELRRKYR